MFYTISASVICSFITYALLIRLRTRRPPMPPGPKKLPLIGNLFDLPAEGDLHPWRSHLEKYGPISSVSVLNRNIILLNNLQASIDLMNKRSVIYAGRPLFPFAGSIVGWDQQMIMAQFGDHFRTMRKLLKSYMGTPASLVKLHPTQILEARIFLGRVLEKSENTISYLRFTAGAISLKLSHGYHIKTENDPLVELVERAAREFYIATRPGSWFVDIIPSLNYLPDWFPGVGRYRRVGSLFRKHNMEQSDRPHNFAKQYGHCGVSPPSFTSTMLEREIDMDTENATKFAATAIYGGGSDPTAATLSTFILLMTLHPDIQIRAQEELDNVTGGERLPSFSDRENLPFVEAVIKEVIRWHTVGRICIPHRSLEDDEYAGYFIPKDSIIIANMWNITHDPSIYSDPDVFDPNRFMADGDKVPELDPTTYIFGFGRRACPGSDFAGEFLFMMVSMMLSAFTIQKKKDERGVDIEPACKFIGGTTCHPVPFTFSIMPRSEKWIRIIKSIYDDAEYTRPNDADKL